MTRLARNFGGSPRRPPVRIVLGFVVLTALLVAAPATAAAVPPPPPNPSDSQLNAARTDANNKAGEVVSLATAAAVPPPPPKLRWTG